MITKDEELFLDNCLKAISSLIDEIIIVDAVSLDKTPEIAKSHNAKVISCEWNNDFSYARNISLSHATKPWILVLDADESINENDFDEIKKLITQSEVDGIKLIQRNYTNDSDKESIRLSQSDKYTESKEFIGWTESPLVRLFRNKKHLRFKGEVHELIEQSILKNNGLIVKSQIPIHHFKENKGPLFLEKKLKMYKELSLKKIQNNPNDPSGYFEYGMIMKDEGRFDDAEKYFITAINKNSDFFQAYHSLGVVLNKKRTYEKAIEAFHKSLSINPKYSPALFSLGVAYSALGKFDEAISHTLRGLEIRIDINALTNLGGIYEKSGQLVKSLEVLQKSVAIAETGKGYYNLAITLAKKGNFKESFTYAKKALMLGYPQEKCLKVITHVGKFQ